MQDSTELSTRKRHGYSPQQTADVRTAQISATLNMTLELSKKAAVKVDLRDETAVRETMERYQKACADCGVLPTIEGAAAQLGVCRRWIYTFLEDHPDEPSAQYIDKKRLEWAACRIALAERGAVDPTMAIFILLNSKIDFTNQHTVSIETPPQNQLDSISAEEAEKLKQKYILSMPDPDDE